MEDLGYSVDFLEGKLKAAVLLIHEPQTKKWNSQKKDNELLLKAHRGLLNRLEDSRKKYKFATPPWTPEMKVVGNMGQGQDNENDNGVSSTV